MPKSQGYFNYAYSKIRRCGTCQRQFNSDKLLGIHKKVVHNDIIRSPSTKEACGNCGFVTLNAEVLKEHQKKCKLLAVRY